MRSLILALIAALIVLLIVVSLVHKLGPDRFTDGRLYQRPGYFPWPEYMTPKDPEYMTDGRLYQRSGYFPWPEYMTPKDPEYMRVNNPFNEPYPQWPEAPWAEWFLTNPLNEPKKVNWGPYYEYCKCCTGPNTTSPWAATSDKRHPSYSDFLRRLANGGPGPILSEKTALKYPTYLPPMVNKSAIRSGSDRLLSTAQPNLTTPPLYTVQIYYTKYCDQHPLLFYFEQIAREYLANCADIESTIGFERVLIDPLLVTNSGRQSSFPKILKVFRDGTITEYNGHSTLDELSNFIHDYRPMA